MCFFPVQQKKNHHQQLLNNFQFLAESQGGLNFYAKIIEDVCLDKSVHGRGVEILQTALGRPRSFFFFFIRVNHPKIAFADGPRTFASQNCLRVNWVMGRVRGAYKVTTNRRSGETFNTRRIFTSFCYLDAHQIHFMHFVCFYFFFLLHSSWERVSFSLKCRSVWCLSSFFCMR